MLESSVDPLVHLDLRAGITKQQFCRPLVDLNSVQYLSLTAAYRTFDVSVVMHCRRLARKKREAELVAFSATRPDDSFESPADLQAIREAEQNMGDFKLKSDPEYVPPEVSIKQVCHKAVNMTCTQTLLCTTQLLCLGAMGFCFHQQKVETVF